jgi:methionyl-tRNA formyltransferase
VSSGARASAIVFAYHNVGVRCLKVLLDGGVDVPLVVTHADNPAEAVWFASVAAVAAERGLRCITPADANADAVVAECRRHAPDFLFSFYYRQMLQAPLLALPGRGAYNMHGSLLPRYRGRAPVNWAVLHGERETGASLHAMELKPDRGALVDQCAVPILGDDTAREVFDKVSVAAEIVLARSLPQLIAGTAVLTPQVPGLGSYFGGRRAEDGRMPATAGGRQVHDLVRAVAPPEYPGAFFDCRGVRIGLARTQVGAVAEPARGSDRFTVYARDGALWLQAVDGVRLRILAASLDGAPLDAAGFVARFGAATLAPDL